MAENPKAKDDPATKVASGKRNRQAVMEDVSPASNPNVPIRPTTNNDPGKVPTPEQLAPIAQQNSNVGIQPTMASVPSRPAGSPPKQPLTEQGDNQDRDYIFGLKRGELDEYAKQKNLSPSQRALVDEAKYQFMSGTHALQSESDKQLFSNAVNPNTEQYAKQQQAAYQKGVSQPLTRQDVADITGVEQGRYTIPTQQKTQGTAMAPAQSQAKANAIATTVPDDDTLKADLQKLAATQGKDFNKLSEAERNRWLAEYRVYRTSVAQAQQRQAPTQPATKQPLVPTMEGVPTRTSTPSHQRDVDYFTKVATSREASPDDREMAKSYLLVNQIKNNPTLQSRYGRMLEKDIRTFEKQLQSQARTEKRQAPHIQKARGLEGTRAEQLLNLKRTNPRAYQLQVWREVLRQPQYRGLELQLGF